MTIHEDPAPPASWPEGMQVIVRRERPHPGGQLDALALVLRDREQVVTAKGESACLPVNSDLVEGSRMHYWKALSG